MWWQTTALLRAYTVDLILGAVPGIVSAAGSRGSAMKASLSGSGLPDSEAPASPRPDEALADQILSQPGDFGLSSLDMITLCSRYSRCLGIDRCGLADLLLVHRSLNGWLQVAERSLNHLAEQDSAEQGMGFYSSGSMASPRLSEHSWQSLHREMAAFARHVDGVGRIVCTVLTHHIYGFLWGPQLATVLGCPLERLRPDMQAPSQWEALYQEGDLIVATPELWQLMLALDLRLPARFIAVSSSAALPTATFQAFIERYPEARLLEIYGSSETRGIGWREHPEQGFQLLPYWRLDNSGPREAASSLIDQDSGQVHALPDHLQPLAEGEGFRIAGRVDGMVQIAGHNIDLDRVAATLKMHPEVNEAYVRCQQTPQGPALKAQLCLVRAPQHPDAWCTGFSNWQRQHLGNLPPFQSILLCDAPARSSLGKVVDWNVEGAEAMGGCYHQRFTSQALETSS